MTYGRGDRVLVVSSYPDSLVRFRGALLSTLRSEGYAVHVVAPGLAAGSSMHRVLEDMGCVVHDVFMERSGMSPISDVRTLCELTNLCRQVRPTHVLAYTVKPITYGLWAARRAGIPHRFALITGLGFAFSRRSPLSLLLGVLVRRLYASALRGVEVVFFQNPDDERVIRGAGLLDPETETVVVNGSGVDLDEFAASPVPDGVHFLMIARLLGAKGVREYAEAARRVGEIHGSASFALVGWVDEGPDAINQSEVDAWVASGSIEFLGRLEDVRPALENCSVYVLPSYAEGTPRTVLEAMAMGRAIVTTDAPGCRETVVDSENGFLVPVGSADALAAAMERFIDDPTLAAAMGARSREIAECKYDVHSVNALMMERMGL